MFSGGVERNQWHEMSCGAGKQKSVLEVKKKKRSEKISSISFIVNRQ